MSTLPAAVAKMLARQTKETSEDVIIRYYCSPQGMVELTEEQEAMRQRWEMADDLIRSNKYTAKQVASMLSNYFGTGVATARRDMDSAKTVFGSARPVNKRYLLAMNVELIQDAIVAVKKLGKPELLPKLFDSFTKAVMALPEDKGTAKAPTAIIFNIGKVEAEHLNINQISESDAERIARERGAIIDLEEDEYTID